MMSTSRAVEAARHLAVGAAAHHERAARASPIPSIAAEKPGGDRQHRHEDDHDAGDADDGHGRRARALQESSAGCSARSPREFQSDRIGRHRQFLEDSARAYACSQVLRSASVMRRRIAPPPASRPRAGPSATIRPTPSTTSRGGQHEDRQHAAGRIAALHEQPRDAEAQRAADERDEQRLGEHQRQDRAAGEARASCSTASSLVRSRTDCAIVLAATSPNMKSTAERDRRS